MKTSPGTTILAIHPERPEQRIFDRMPPLGMAWIAAVLEKAGYPVRFVDGQVESIDPVRLAEETKPAVTLIGGSSHCRFDAFSYASAIKGACPRTTVVYGGPHASFTAEETLNAVGDIDVVVHGEGEYVTLDLVRWKESGAAAHDLERIKGISYRKDGGVVSTGWAERIRNLDLLPFPARDLLPLQSYAMTLEYLKLPAMHIMTARGCPFECSFCSASRMFGASYVRRSPNHVADEVELLVKRYGIQGLKIFDSTFTVNRNHVVGFCEALESRGLVMPWECEIRVGSVDKSLLERMQKAGCYYVDIGIESGDQDVLNEMSKNIRLDDARNLLHWCRELGLRTKVFFTVGHINETYRAGLKTIRFIKEHKKSITMIGYNPFLRIYPGTRIEAFARERRLLPPHFTWSTPFHDTGSVRVYLPASNVPFLVQPQLGIKELRKLRQRYILSRIASFRFIVFKILLLVRHHDITRYAVVGLKSVFGCKRRV